MTTKSYEYIAQRYHARSSDSAALLLFVAPAGEIRTWAGVPRKAFDYQHGFQRSLTPSRVREVADFFSADPRNLSPTAIVVGFTSRVTVQSISPAPSTARQGTDLVRVRIDMPDLSRMPIEELTDRAVAAIRTRLPDTVIAAIDNDRDTAIAEAIRLQDEEVVDEFFGVSANDFEDVEGVETPGRSYLADFYAQLLGFKQRVLTWPDEELLRETLYSVLKPAIIVDGQHRVFGAATVDQGMLLAVSAIQESSWTENVFQFVVINQKAKPIKPAFLSAIVATSLSGEEIDSVYDRLHSSNIDVERAQEMERVNIDTDSPFRGMINFEVEGSPGFLQFPGMLRLAREFAGIPRSHPVLVPSDGWSAATGDWMLHFFALWRGVRSYFETGDARLWQKPSEESPNNLLKIVTLQEVQRLMLDTWADGRTMQLIDPSITEQQAHHFWEGFPVTFFTDEWRKKGLQTSVGRRIIRDCIIETRRNLGRRNWGHRRLGLFSD